MFFKTDNILISFEQPEYAYSEPQVRRTGIMKAGCIFVIAEDKVVMFN